MGDNKKGRERDLLSTLQARKKFVNGASPT